MTVLLKIGGTSDLQTGIALLSASKLELPWQFDNFRD